MVMGLKTISFLLIILIVFFQESSCQVLNPPSFNLAEGRRINASATCGEDYVGSDGDSRELYCKLVGANWYDNVNKHIFQGQACDYCVPGIHKADYAIDGTERWWQSPPLSRGVRYNEVNLTIDLGQEFHVAYVFIKMANSPRPGVWILERSKDYGKTYTPWQFFADNYDDCQSIFGVSTRYISRDDSVICETKFSKVLPLENGEIAVSLLNGRPSAETFSLSQTLQEFTKATNVRLRLLRPKTTLAHLISIAKQDPTVTRRYFYSIKDINIGGRCVCNGHANSCDITDNSQPPILKCKCQHNTDGSQCEVCRDGYSQKAWKPATVDNPNICQKCNCFNHTEDCYYDPDIDRKKLSLDMNGVRDGGGVCVNCQHNTEGINCDRCKDGFYRPFNRPLDDSNVCQPCDCNPSFHNGSCAEGSGKCFCKPNFEPDDCSKCASGYYDYPVCRECDCNLNGTIGSLCQIGNGECPCKPEFSGQSCRNCSEGHFGFPSCNPCNCNGRGVVSTARDKCDIETGQCLCTDGFSGRQCDQCEVGYFNYPSCLPCSCDVTGTTEEVCDKNNGRCICKEGYTGPRCDRCLDGYHGYPNCTTCDCDPTGSSTPICSTTGKCRCLTSFGGLKCADCSVGHFKYPECLPCKCDSFGSHGMSCDIDGRCFCKKNFDGEKCGKCKEGYYNYPACEECNCDPAGVVVAFKGCGSVAAGELCKCKDRVTGRICNQCKDLFWNLNQYNKDGCEDCRCNRPGTVNSVGNCESVSGQCVCRQNVESRICENCKSGTFALQEGNLFGCTDCRCDVGGAVNALCDKYDGQCTCKPKIKGRRCDEPLQTYYYPTLYQHKYEIEDGRTVSDSPARFGYDESVFPDYSWRGYASFTNIMREVIWIVSVQKPSFYNMIFRYVNNGSDSVAGVLSFRPFNAHEDDQQVNVFFEPTKVPRTEFATTKFKQINQVLLSPGNWTAALRVDKDILIDFMVLIPEAYYEARLLRESDSPACRDNQAKGSLCRFYTYPRLSSNATTIRGDDGREMRPKEGVTPTKKWDDVELSKKLKASGNMAVINSLHTNFLLDFKLPAWKTGKYAVVINYHNPSTPGVGVNDPTKLEVKVINNELPTVETDVVLSDCPYSFLCRQVITLGTGEVAPLDLTPSATLSLEPTDIVQNKTLLIESVSAIPLNEWSLDYITPKVVCVMKDMKCIDSSFAPLGEGIKVEFERYHNPERVTVQNGASLVSVNNTENFVEIRGTVPSPARYKFIVHYLQPDSPSYDAEVTLNQDEEFFNAMTQLSYCPTLSGCRSVIHQRESNSSTFYIRDNFGLTIRVPPGKSVLMDYIIAIPVDAVDDNAMLIMPQHLSDDFIKECGQNAFEITSQNSSDFCRRSVFSLTVDYNGMAFPCKCSIQGSKSYECESFGGQCQCKPNVIGRQCTRCKTGYYGFPDCKQCNCPSTAYCHPRTGKCICPPKVTGEKCDQCMIHTYGYDQYLGCEECDCHSRGVLKLPNGKADLQCNVTTGQCPCRQTIVGRKCDRCLPGYAYFPHCQLCNCDIRGVTEEICNQDNSACFCKDNVRGENCDVCAPDAFFLEESNPDGCTKCFCFGNTDRCLPSQMIKTVMSRLEGDWRLMTVTIDDKVLDIRQTLEAFIETQDGNWRAVIPADDDLFAIKTNYYMSVPKSYLGKKIQSYGGDIKYGIINEVSRNDYRGSSLAFDVVLVGSNLTIGYQQDEQPEAPGTSSPFFYTIPIIERHFKHLNRNPVTREQMMMVLVKLEAIYLRVSYFRPSQSFQVVNFSMDSAEVVLETPVHSSWSHSTTAPRVEQCLCPKNYKGSSCEECNDGYYRAKTGPYLGFCVPCQCNGHSEECDVNTGKCFNCKHNTHGDHCEFCDSGYYGNATKGTAYDCLICPCPRPDASNNFATSCEVSEDGLSVSCKCKPGYVEPLCDYCSAGYYGKPYELGDTCKPCECNNNIDPLNPGSCDSVTGICQLCLNNTFGQACELCASGFYGDAIQRKDCKACNCESCGTSRCDPFTGICECKPNVVGDLCDQCKKDHYGLNTCDGCVPCACGNASLSSGCDFFTGQCQCAPGVGGRTCDHCEPGFWKYSPDGCTSCNCGMKYSYGAVCDQEVGQCQCLPGVIGEKCDSCPWRWVFIDNVGCKQCDDCTHFLLDDTDYMRNITNNAFKDLRDASIGLFAQKKAQHIKKTMDEYQQYIRDTVEKPSVKLSPVDVSLKEVERTLSALDSNSSLLSRAAQKACEDANLLKETSLEHKDIFKQVINHSMILFQELKNLEESFSNPVLVQNIEEKIHDAESILDYLKTIDYTDQLRGSRSELDTAKTLTETIDTWASPERMNSLRVNDTFTQLHLLEERLWQLSNMTSNVTAMVVRTEQLGALATESQETINNDKTKSEILMTMVQAAITEAREKLRNSESYMTSYESRMIDILEATKQLLKKKDRLKRALEDKKLVADDLHDLVRESIDHSFKLFTKSKELERLFQGTKEGSKIYIAAAEANNYIIGNMTEAINASKEAEKAVIALGVKKDANKKNVDESLEKSNILKQEAAELTAKFDTDLSVPLSFAVSNVSSLESSLDLAKKANEGVTSKFREIDLLRNNVNFILKLASNDSANALSTGEAALRRVSQIQENIDEDSKRGEKIPEEYRAVIDAIKSGELYAQKMTDLLNNRKDNPDKANEKANRVNDLQSGLDKHTKELRERIASARGLANRIELGVDVKEDTSIQLRNPDSFIQSGIYSKFAMSFKTKEYNALLAYIGNPVSTPVASNENIQGDQPDPEVTSSTEAPSSSPSSGDFMAIEIRNSRVVFTIDLGSGPEKTDNGMFVSNDVWHDIIVERIGKSVVLLVSANDSRQERSDSILTGSNNVLNLDPLRSRIYVSGLPSGVTVQKEVINTKLKSGQVANVVFGDTPLGLWNFVEGIGNRNGAEGKVVQADSVSSNGLRFDGNSYVILQNNRHNFSIETYFKFAFKTYAKEGIMFLLEDGSQGEFLSVFMFEGRVHLSFDLGSGYVQLSSRENKVYNDGNWHSVDVSRNEKAGILKVDEVEVDVKDAIGLSQDLNVNDKMYFGGYPSDHKHPIPHVNFEGCIQDVQMTNVLIDLSKNIEASPNVVKGCPAAVSREASYIGSKGFIEMPLTTDINDKVVLSLKYRTLERPGLLFYASNEDHSSSLALYLNEIGQLVLRSEPGGSLTSTKNSYYGDSWHYVTASKDGDKISIEVDDVFDDVASTSGAATLNIFDSSQPRVVYFAGVPGDQKYILAGKAIATHFTGCFGDVTLNTIFQNFATSSNRPGASLASCPLNSQTSSGLPGSLNRTDDGITTPDTSEETSVILEGCSIALNPSQDLDVPPEAGLRFGNGPDTRNEFNIPSDRTFSLQDKTDISMEFKTKGFEGVLLYVSDAKHTDFLTLFLQEGRVYYSWSNGGKTAVAGSNELVNDGQWHKLLVHRTGKSGYMTIDEGTQIFLSSHGDETGLNVRNPIFVGGLPDDTSKSAKNNIRGVINSFPGCLRNLMIQGVPHDFGKDSISFGSKPCSSKVESGVFFHPLKPPATSNFMVLKDKFRVGERIKIDLKIRPRSHSGVLLSVSSKPDFLILQIINGSIHFTVDNGGGPFSVVKSYGKPLCDGNWHTIQAVKERNIITLSLDDGDIAIAVGTGGISSTDTSDPLYLGGVPSGELTPGLETKEQFVGCISDIKLSDRLQPSTSVVYGDVTLNSCPTT